jgi:hypothetical protein
MRPDWTPFRGIAQLYQPGTMSSPLLMAFVARQLHLRGLVSGMLQVACRALDSSTSEVLRLLSVN